MSSASDDGSEYNPDRNRQHDEGEGSPEQSQSGRAAGKGKTSKTSQQIVKLSKSQTKQKPNVLNMPPLSPNYAPYPPEPLGPSTQTDDNQVKADRQQLYDLLRHHVAPVVPQGVSLCWLSRRGIRQLTYSQRLACRDQLQTMRWDLSKVLQVVLPSVCEYLPLPQI
jgi:hypothetical protein